MISPSKTRRPAGFTIVELLIVIVVIAILAAISIVAYNGIQDRANRSSAQSAATQAAKAIALHYAQNEAYPPDLAAASITNTDGLQYRVDNTANPKTYCITSTTANRSYFVSSTTTAPTEGGCPGHGAGGVAAVTNYALNPSGAGSTNGVSSIGSGPAPRTVEVATDRSHHGPSSLKLVTTGAGTLNAVMSVPSDCPLRVNAGERLTWSVWVNSTKAGTMSAWVEGNRISDGSYWGGSGGSSPALTANTWTKIVGTNSPAVDVCITRAGAYSLPAVSGDTLWMDEVTITKTDTPIGYADGESDGWVWNGTPNASSSTGPRLP